jgi:outer membrane protein
MRKLYIALFSAGLISASAHAQQPVKLSLDDCMNYALKNNYTLKNAHLDVLIQQEQVKQTTAAALPHVNGKLDWSHFIDPQYSFFGARAFAFGLSDSALNLIPKDQVSRIPFTIPYTVNTSATVAQTIFDGSILVALQARNTVMDLARETEKRTVQDVKYNIYKAYNALTIAHKQFDLVSGSLVLARELQNDLIKTREAGFAEKIDVDRTAVQINNLATDSMRLYNMLSISEQMLKYVIGMDINTPIVLIDTSIDKKTAGMLALLNDRTDYAQLPEYSSLLIALKLNQFNLKRYKLAALPSLSGFYSYGFNTGQYNGSKVLNRDQYQKYSLVGLSLNVPIFNGFARVHQTREARLNVEKTQNTIEFVKQSIDFQATASRTSLRNSLLQVQSQKRNLELANSVLELAQKKYKEGVGSNMEVTNAQTEVLRSQNNYFAAMLDVVNSEADLRKALGLLK